MTIRRNLLISFFFICLALSNSQVYGSDKIETVTLQLIWKNQFQFAGYYVARELGFYNDVGLDVTIKEYEFGTDVTQDVLSQKAHFGVGRSALVLESMEGKDVYLLSAIFQYSPFMLLAKKRDDLKQVSDLKGKRIMVTDDFVGMASLTAMLLANGIKSDSYTSQKHTFNIDDLISGKTDAVASYISNEPYQMEKRGIDYTIFAPKDHGFNFYSDILFTSQGLYKDNPELVKRFYQASLQGWAYAFSHIDEAVDLILKQYNTQNRRKDALLFEANTLKTLAYDKGVPLGNINKNRIAQIAQIYRLMGLTHQPLKTDNLILEDTPQIKLTSQEQAWLARHTQIRVGIMNAWPPLNYVDEKGIPRGVGVDYLNAINNRLGGVLNVVPAPFKESLDAVKSKSLDALMDITPKPDREPFFNFTTSYLTIPQIIVGHKDKPYFSGDKDLYGKTVALESGYYTIKRFKRDHPEIQIREYTNTSDCLDAVSRGEADAYVGNRAVAIYLMEKELITNLRVMGRTSQPPVPLSIGIRKDWPELAEILNKALASLSPQEVQAIHRRWAKKNDLPTKALALTPEEKTWLDKHPVVRARIGKALPLHFFDGKPLGISVDYLNLIARRAGFTVQYVTDIPWSKALDDIKKHETIDLLLTAKVTPERRNHMAFTKDYLLMPWVIFAQKDSSIGSMEDLMDKTVAVERDYVMHKKLAAEYPDIKLLIKGTSQEAIEAVATGGADAYIGNLTIGVYIVRQNNLNNVKVAASTPFGNHDQAMAIRDDWPELAGIIDKGLAAISEKDRNEILTRYLGILSIEGSKTAQTRVALTPEEQAWISKHKVLRIGADSAWPPYDFVDGSGKHRGVAADVLALLSKRLGLSFNLVPGLTWEGILEAARERRLDIVSALTVTPERATYLKFSNPLTSAPWVIVTEKDFRPVENLGNMTKDKVAMAKDYAIIELSRQAFPDLPIRTVASPLAGLEAVMSHQMDAYVGNLGVVSYLIQQNGLTNLRIAAAAGMETPPIAIGIRSDWPELVRILNKGLESISREDMSAIYKRWIPVEMSSIQPKGEIPISFGRLIGYGVALLLVIILLAWLIFKKSSRMGISAGFGSARFRLIVLAGLTFFIIVILLIGWFSLSRIKSDILQDVEKNLRGTLLIAKQGLGLWESGRKAFMKHFGDEPKLVASTEQLLKAPPDRKALAASEALREVRNYFKENKNVFPNIGFFIISPEKISIGSTRDINLGTPNLISLQYPELIKRAFEGHVGFVPPIESDIQLGKASKSDAKRPSTMFFVGPIRKPDGKIIAVMTLIVDPSQDFSRAVTIVGGGGTEETYAFTQGGRLISDSKFDEQLQHIGLIGEGEKAVLNIEIRDPGVNMVEGHRPLIERSRQPLTRMAAGAIALKSRMETVGADYGHSEIEMDMAGYRDYRGVPVFGAWVWDANLKLGIATEIDVDEALSSYYRIRIIVLGVLGLTLVLFAGSTLFVLRIGERTHRALTKARDDLEDKVEERTTELREKQEQLSVAEERSRLLLDSAGEGIFGVSSEGQCTFANPSSLDMLGYTQDEIVGKDIHDLIHHTQADGTPYPAEDCPMSRAYTHGESETISDEMLWRKDGIGFSVEYTATPMKKDGKTVGAVVTFNDITEQKQLEKSLQIRITELADARLASLNMMEDIEESRKKAEEATQAKSDFLSSMSHELRTPLNAIIGFSEVLRDQYFGELNEKQVEYTNDILESGKHLLSLINDILDLSKVEAGKMELNLSQVNIKALLKSSLVMIKEKALKRGIALDLKIPEGLSGLEIQADERKVKQVMFNLLSNAAKFTPDGGKIRVTVDLISELGIRILELKEDEKQLAIQNPKSKIEVCVADNGIGLSPENQGKIFQEFYQVRGGTTDKSPGTGLGLPLTKSFVEMHGGRIWVESKGEGKGSRFSFLLPVKFEDLEIDAGLLNNLRSLASSYEKHKRPFTLCYLQIDREHFKEEAPRIREAFVKEKRGDDILSMDKWGNVYLVIQGTDGEKIKAACNRLIKKMKSMFEGLEISYSTATFPEDGDTPEAIIKKVRKT